MKIITRKQASIENLIHYFTGKPCKRGHICERRTSNGSCISCDQEEQKRNQKIRLQRFREKHGVEYARNKSKEHYQQNKQDYVDRAIKWNNDNPEKVKTIRAVSNKRFKQTNSKYFSDWWSNNLDKVREYRTREYTKISRTKWNANNKGKKNHYTRLRQANIKQATPKWVNLEQIKLVYIQAAALTKSTGIHHEVDHIIPLRGKKVCGLHIVENLQILTKNEHKFKLNKFIVE